MFYISARNEPVAGGLAGGGHDKPVAIGVPPDTLNICYYNKNEWAGSYKILNTTNFYSSVYM